MFIGYAIPLLSLITSHWGKLWIAPSAIEREIEKLRK